MKDAKFFFWSARKTRAIQNRNREDVVAIITFVLSMFVVWAVMFVV